MWYAVYNLLTTPVWIFLHISRPLLSKEFKERLGQIPKRFEYGAYWFHCASVGELSAISGLVSETRKREPDPRVIITTVTKTGKRRAQKLFPFASSFLAPLDCRPYITCALDRIKPSVLFIAETELWPNLMRLAAVNGVAVVVVNGRLTQKSLRRYLPLRPLFNRALSSVRCLFVQTEDDRFRFERLGAPAARIRVTGTMKSDFLFPQVAKGDLLEEFSLPLKRKIVVAGSVRPEEEEVLMSAVISVVRRCPSTYFVVAPRHVQRAQNLAILADNAGMKVRFRSDGDSHRDEHVLILDTMGELTRIYGAADISFVGGSLKPYGGHNLLEPAVCGVPVLFGKFTDNCRSEAEELISSEAGMRVESSEDLASKVCLLLGDDAMRSRMGSNAREVVSRRSGISRVVYEELRDKGILGEKHDE